MFLLESPHRGDSNENTKYTIFNIKKKITLAVGPLLTVPFTDKSSYSLHQSHEHNCDVKSGLTAVF